MGVQTMKYTCRATEGCRTPKHKDLGFIAAHDHETMERYVGLRSLCIVGRSMRYSWWGWVSIILVEELDGLKA
eukprot:COSAG01_NODE_4866_length_4670_cov_16.414789_2_plen_73_part_00